MTELLETLFGWPNGIVVGNLIASAIWAAPALWHLHRKLNRHHREQLAARPVSPPGDGGRGARQSAPPSGSPTPPG